MKKMILLFEDHGQNRDFAVHLPEHHGNDVIPAANGALGIEAEVEQFIQKTKRPRRGSRFWPWMTGALSILMLVASARIVRSGEPAASEGAERYVRYGFTVQNITGQLVPEVELWACAPLRETSVQRLSELKASHPYAERTDGLGNHFLQFVFSNVPPFAVRIVTVEATVAMNAEPLSVAAETGRWLQAGPLFVYDNEAFSRLAPEFPKDAAATTARAIYDWVRGYLQDVGYDGTDRGALYALTQKKGDCTEYTTLFVALCRRAGIPARAMGGYVVSQNTILDPASYHNWAEFFADGRWHLADPLSGVWRDRGNAYVATRVIGTSDTPLGDFPRFRYRGDGIKAVMTK